MAELRCPMCSKLNPDTLEVCQFCGARLKPLVLPSSGALDIPAERAKSKADDKPAGQQASGDDWFSSLRSEDSGSSESSATGNVDDWLARLRQQDEAEETVEPPAVSQPPAPATPKPAGTDWLGALRASTDQLPSWLAEPVESDENQPEEENWLSRLGGSSDETIVSAPKPKPEPIAKQPEAEPALPPWLAEPSEPAALQETDDTLYVSGPGSQPAAEAPAWPPAEPEAPTVGEPSQIPDWLKSYNSSSSDETIVRRPAATPTPVSPEPASELPDWLTGQPASSEPSSSVPDWMRSSGPDETIAAAPSDLPDWLKGDLPAQPTTPQPAPAPAASSTLPNWLESNQAPMPGTADDETISVSPDDIPDWLKGGEPATAPTPPASEKPSSNDAVVGITDWFESAESSAPAPAPKTGTSDWLKSKEPETPSDSPRSVVGVTDWLSSFPKQAPVDDNLDWLKPPETPVLPPQEAPAEKAPPGTTDWLNSLGVTTPPKPSTKELRDRGTGWLSAVPDAQKSPDAQAAARKPGTGQLKPGTGQLKPGTGQLKPPTGQLKPGTGGLKPDTGQLKPDTGGLKSDTGNLLARFKDTTPPAEMPSGSATAITGLTGWLSSLQQPAPPPPPTTPDESGKAIIGTTDWLNSLASDPKKTGAIKTGWLGSLPLEQSPTSSTDPEQQSKALFGATDWLSQLAASAPATPFQAETPEANAAPELPKAEIPDWLSNSGTAMPDWASPKAPAEADSQPAAETPSASSGKAVIGTTDWLRSLEANKGFDLSNVNAKKSDVSDLDWLNIGPATPPAPAFSEEPAPTPEARDVEPASKGGSGQSAPPFNTTVQTGELPSWLTALKPEGIEAVPSTGPLPTPATPSAPPPSASPASATPAVTAEDLPDWMRPDAEQTTQTQKAVPAVSSSDETVVARPPAAKPPTPVPAFTSPVGPAADDLTTASLPNWLNALRPLDARATSREPEPDHEEATGPLAGMRGVLPAESIISMAGRPGASVAGFLLTDQQTKLADNLRALVKEEATEQAEIKPHKRARVNFSFSRLLVSVVLLFIIVVPFVLGPLLFPPPTVSPLTGALHTKIEQLPVNNSVVLLAVDYDPAFSGELNPAVNSVMVHLMKHGAHVITVSTSPAGAGIAQMLLTDPAFVREADLANDAEGKQYLNLGFIPGTAAGLRQFATDPTGTIKADYYGNDEPFKRDVLVGFESFDNINLVIVATASADTLRTWIEQVGPTKRPMAAITSASVAPLAAPYTTGSKPQLLALVSGLSGALEYDTVSQRTSDKADVLAREWSAFGLSLYASAGILVLGALASLVSIFMRRPAQAKAAARPHVAAQPKPKATKRKAAPKVEEPMPAEPDFSTSAGAFDDIGTFGEPTYLSEGSSSQLETMVATPKKTKTAKDAKTTKTTKTTKTAKAPVSKQGTKPQAKTNGTGDDTQTTKPRLRKV